MDHRRVCAALVGRAVCLLLPLVVLFACSSVSAPMNDEIDSNRPMNRETAWRLTASLAKSLRASLDEAQHEADGSYYLELKALVIEFRAAERVLIARGTVFLPYAPLAKQTELLGELARIAETDPDVTAGARFELAPGKWEQSPEPALYLRLDFHNGGVTEASFEQRCRALSDAAYTWHRIKLREVVERVSALQRNKKSPD